MKSNVFDSFNSFFNQIFFFLETPSSAKALAFFRVSVAMFCIFQSCYIYDDLLNLYSANGIIQWEISEVFLKDWMPHLSTWTNFLENFGVAENRAIYLLLYCYIMVLFILLIGWQTRIAAIIAWYIHLIWLNTGAVFTYGVDMFMHISLFYFMFMPVGATFSVDNLRKKYIKISYVYGLSLKVLQIHMCIMYFWSGIEKTFNIDWWTGDAIWKSVMMSEFNQVDFSWLASVSWLPMIIGWGALIIEIGYIFFIWHSKTRPIWLVMTISLHLGIGLFLGLWLFAFMMIILNVSAFGWDYIEAFASKIELKKWLITKLKKQSLLEPSS